MDKTMDKTMDKDKLGDIEKAVKRYADKRDAVSVLVRELESACRVLVARRSNALKLRVEAMEVAKAALHDVIWETPECFEQPKTQAAHGVKFGYRKQPDRFDFLEDEAKTLALIERAGDEFAQLLIKRQASVVKSALKGLDERALKRLKVKRVTGEDEVLIKDEAAPHVGDLLDWLQVEMAH